MSTASNMLKQKKYDIQQFILNDVIVKEDRVYRTYSMDKFFHRNNNQNNMREKSTINYNKELEIFKNKI